MKQKKKLKVTNKKKYSMQSVFKNLIKEHAEGYDASDELEPFEDEIWPSDEQILKEAMAQLRYESIPYSAAKMLANDVVAMLTGQSFSSRGEFEDYVAEEVNQRLRSFWESKEVDKSKKVIKEEINDNRKQQLEKIIEGCDQRFRSSKFVVHIGRGNGDYNSPLRVQLIHQGIPIPMVNYYQDCEGGSHIIPAPEIENLIRKVRRTLEENGIRFFDIEVS